MSKQKFSSLRPKLVCKLLPQHTYIVTHLTLNWLEHWFKGTNIIWSFFFSLSSNYRYANCLSTYSYIHVLICYWHKPNETPVPYISSRSSSRFSLIFTRWSETDLVQKPTFFIHSRILTSQSNTPLTTNYNLHIFYNSTVLTGVPALIWISGVH